MSCKFPRPPWISMLLFYVSRSVVRGLIYFVHSQPCVEGTNNIEISGVGNCGCMYVMIWIIRPPRVVEQFVNSWTYPGLEVGELVGQEFHLCPNLFWMSRKRQTQVKVLNSLWQSLISIKDQAVDILGEWESVFKNVFLKMANKLSDQTWEPKPLRSSLPTQHGH